MGFFSYKKGLFTVINPFNLPPYKPILKGVNPEDVVDLLDRVEDVRYPKFCQFIAHKLTQVDVWEEMESAMDDDIHQIESPGRIDDLQFRFPLGNPIKLKVNKIKK